MATVANVLKLFFGIITLLNHRFATQMWLIAPLMLSIDTEFNMIVLSFGHQ